MIGHRHHSSQVVTFVRMFAHECFQAIQLFPSQKGKNYFFMSRIIYFRIDTIGKLRDRGTVDDHLKDINAAKSLLISNMNIMPVIKSSTFKCLCLLKSLMVQFRCKCTYWWPRKSGRVPVCSGNLWFK